MCTLHCSQLIFTLLLSFLIMTTVIGTVHLPLLLIFLLLSGSLFLQVCLSFSLSIFRPLHWLCVFGLCFSVLFFLPLHVSMFLAIWMSSYLDSTVHWKELSSPESLKYKVRVPTPRSTLISFSANKTEAIFFRCSVWRLNISQHIKGLQPRGNHFLVIPPHLHFFTFLISLLFFLSSSTLLLFPKHSYLPLTPVPGFLQ